MQALVQSTMWQEYIYQDPTSSHPYFVYTPTTYHVGTAVPLFVMLHGCTQSAADFAAGTRMNQLAEQYGFIVVYPQQTRTSNRTLCWNWFKSSHQFRDRGEPAIILTWSRPSERIPHNGRLIAAGSMSSVPLPEQQWLSSWERPTRISMRPLVCTQG